MTDTVFTRIIRREITPPAPDSGAPPIEPPNRRDPALDAGWLRGPIGAIVALPLVLPPTVIGFYLLLALGPHGFLGQLTQSLGLGTLTFSFAGLVIGSVLYSMPFVVQPLQNAFSAIGTRPLEVAATLRARARTSSMCSPVTRNCTG